MSAKHTPLGELPRCLVVNDHSRTHAGWALIDPDAPYHRAVVASYMDKHVADFFAAAPELLAACEAFIAASERPNARGTRGTAERPERPERPTEKDWRAALTLARAAIAKAGGK